MSEYITEFYGSTSGNGYTERREEIVRCRDCKRMRDWTEEEELASYGEEELADGWCTFLRIGTYDGFYCAWGEKRTKLDDARNVQ